MAMEEQPVQLAIPPVLPPILVMAVMNIMKGRCVPSIRKRGSIIFRIAWNVIPLVVSMKDVTRNT